MRNIFLFGLVDTYSAQDIILQLLELDKQGHEPINLFINSPGGSVHALFAITDTMNLIKSPVKTIAIGLAASSAAVILANGDERFATEDSTIVIHEAWTIMGGSVSQIEEQAKSLTNQQDKLIRILTKQTGKSKEQILADIKKTDKEFSSKEAVAYGLIDEVLTQKNAADKFKLSETLFAPNFSNISADFKIENQKCIHILKTGTFNTSLGKLTITKEIMESLKNNLKNNIRGIDIAFDYTHDNDSGEKKAACWIKDLEIKQNENGYDLFALVEYTPTGQKLVEEKEYKYASVEFVVDYTTDNGKHYNYVLLGGTLTNRPQIKGMSPIKLSEERDYKMTKAELIQALKAHGIDIDEMQNSVTTLQAQIVELNKLPAEKEDEIKNLKVKLSEATAKVKETLVKAEAAAKETAFNSLVRECKVTPAQKESILNLFETAEAMNAFYKEAPKVVNSKPAGNEGSGADQDLTPEEQEVVNQGMLTKDEILANREIN